jgi:hypothetical protein
MTAFEPGNQREAAGEGDERQLGRGRRPTPTWVAGAGARASIPGWLAPGREQLARGGWDGHDDAIGRRGTRVHGRLRPLGGLRRPRRDFARARLVRRGERRHAAAAEGGFDYVVSALVLNFLAEPARGVSAMSGAHARTGPLRAAWDYGEGFNSSALLGRARGAGRRGMGSGRGTPLPALPAGSLVQLFGAQGFGRGGGVQDFSGLLTSKTSGPLSSAAPARGPRASLPRPPGPAEGQARGARAPPGTELRARLTPFTGASGMIVFRPAAPGGGP